MSIERVMVTGGGTGGHIYPALAVAGELRKRHPLARFLYVGGKKGLESDLVPREGYEFVALDIRGMERKAGLSSLKSAWMAFVSVFRAMKIMGEFDPDVVVGTGGYASFPVGAAAILTGRPLVLHEQNVYPGLANRILGRFARGIAISWESSKDGFSGKAELVHTGNPIRASVTGTSREDGLKRLNLAPGLKTVLIFGGSQGAMRISGAAISAMKLAEGKDMRMILATGTTNYDKFASQARAEGLDFADGFDGSGKMFAIVPYIHDMAAALSASDLVVARAGALTLAEITAKGLPSILVPHPWVPDDVQRKNARAMQEKGASVSIEDSALDGASLLESIKGLIGDDARLAAMGKAALALAMPDAASKVADLAERQARRVNG